jgi:uncharacterized protein (DUF1697 family)
MPHLRDVLESAGCTEVRTYVNSGNVVLDPGSKRADPGSEIEGLIAEHFGLTVRVITRTPSQMTKLSKRHPFQSMGLDPRFLHVVFLEKSPGRGAIDRLDPDRSPDDRFTLDGRELYVAYGAGQGRSKLTLDYFEKALGVAGTARNWNTVLKLAEMAAG